MPHERQKRANRQLKQVGKKVLTQTFLPVKPYNFTLRLGLMKIDPCEKLFVYVFIACTCTWHCLCGKHKFIQYSQLPIRAANRNFFCYPPKALQRTFMFWVCFSFVFFCSFLFCLFLNTYKCCQTNSMHNAKKNIGMR